MSFVLWVLVYAVLCLGVRAVYRPYAGTRALKVVFFPGVVVAAVLGCAACFVTRTPVRAVNLPWREGEPVELESRSRARRDGRRDLTLPGALALALFPFGALTAAILVLSSALEQPASPLDVELGRLSSDVVASAHTVVEGAVSSVDALLTSVEDEDLDPRDPRLFAFLYLATALLAFVAPAGADFRFIAALTATVALLAYGFEHLGFRVGFLSRGWFARLFYGDRVWESLSFLVACTLGILGVSLVLMGFVRFVELAVARPGPSD